MSSPTKVHVHMRVLDLEKSREFYTRFFGVEPVKAKPGYVKFLPAIGPVNLALTEGARAQGEGAVDHMGIQVDAPETVVREAARVRGAGLAIVEERGVSCCHANQDKFWVTDPDGVRWEVYHLNFDVEEEPRTAAAEACCPAGARESSAAQPSAPPSVAIERAASGAGGPVCLCCRE